MKEKGACTRQLGSPSPGFFPTCCFLSLEPAKDAQVGVGGGEAALTPPIPGQVLIFFFSRTNRLVRRPRTKGETLKKLCVNSKGPRVHKSEKHLTSQGTGLPCPLPCSLHPCSRVRPWANSAPLQGGEYSSSLLVSCSMPWSERPFHRVAKGGDGEKRG